ALRRVPVGEPVDRLRADAGHDADPDADEAAAHDEPPFAQRVLNAFEEAAFERRRLLLDAEARERKVERRRNAEERERDDAERKAVEQINLVEDEAHRSALRLLSDRGDEQPNGGGD